MDKETLAQKARRKLMEVTLSKEKSKEKFQGTLGVGISNINKKRKQLEDSLNY
jgi:hypothetical protein